MNQKLDPDEEGILEAFEAGELKPVDDRAEQIRTAREAARQTFNKSRRINLRLTQRDLERAHSRAREEGIPYQTLLSSVIHKYLDGRLTEKP